MVVYGVGAESFPHRLASDIEEERRVFHVAITRCSKDVVVIADRAAPLPFTAETRERCPPGRRNRQRDGAGATAGRDRSGGATARATARARSGEKGRRKPADPDSPAMAALRAWRLETSRRDKVPPYVVFSDAHLAGIAAALPDSERALSRCPGVGPVKLERYGDDVLAILEPFITGKT